MLSSSFKVHKKSEYKTVISYSQGFWTFSVTSMLSLFFAVVLGLGLFLIFGGDSFSLSRSPQESQVSFILSKVLPLIVLGIWVLYRCLRGPKWQVEISRDAARRIAVRYYAMELVQPSRLSMTVRSTAELHPESKDENPGYWAEVEIAGAQQQSICLKTSMGFPWTANREGSELESVLAGELDLQKDLERGVPK